MKRTQLFTVLLLFVLLLTACQKEKSQYPVLGTQSSMIYHTFEDALDQSTDIVKAKYISSVNHDGNLDYTFQVSKKYVGADVGSTIHMYIPDHSTENMPLYEIGEEYVLLLAKRSDVYYPYPKYLPWASHIYLPCSDLTQASMYGKPISKHSQLGDITSEEDLDQYIVDYLCNHPVEDRPVDTGAQFIHSTDLQTVVTQSDFVAVVKVNEISPSSWGAWDRDEWCCTVEEGLKGELTKNAEIEIIFPKNSVETGDRYVVALRFVGSTLYSFAAPNSMYELSELSRIQEYLGIG